MQDSGVIRAVGRFFGLGPSRAGAREDFRVGEEIFITIRV